MVINPSRSTLPFTYQLVHTCFVSLSVFVNLLCLSLPKEKESPKILESAIWSWHTIGLSTT